MTNAPLDLTPSPATGRATRRRAPRRRRWTSGLLAGAAVVGGLGLGTLGAGPAQAAEEVDLARFVQRCDATACFYAWNVVDSDGDGVSDADELAAGTDPYDARSVPGLKDLTAALVRRELPSFEHGLAALVAMPPELVEVREQATGEGRLAGLGFDGLPVPARKDALAALGVSTDLMEEHGIDLGRDGFTLGLDGIGSGKEGAELPPIRINGMDRSWISAGDAGHGGGEGHDDGGEESHDPGGHPPTTPAPGETGEDGEYDVAPLYQPPGVPYVDQQGDSTLSYYKDGSVRVDTPHGGALHYPNGGYITWTTPPTKYTNPDAEDATKVDPAAVEEWKRVAGAATKTVEGWRGPGDRDLPEDRRTHIVLIDSNLAIDALVLFDAPRITTVQPEVAPGFGDPGQPGPRTGGGDCRIGFCAG